MVTICRKLSSPTAIFVLLLVTLQFSTAAVYAATATSAGGTYTVLDPPNGTNIFVAGINNAGQVAGSFSDGPSEHGFLFSGGAYTLLDPPHSAYCEPLGLNDSGQVVGYFVDAYTGRSHGFLFSAGVYSTLDPPDSTDTTPFCINDSGQIVGYYNDAGVVAHGFLYSGGDYAIIDPPNSSASFPRFINGRGQIVGSFYDGGTTSHAFLYSSGAYAIVDPPNTQHAFVAAIDNAGDIVGTFDDDSGRHGFLFNGSSYTVLEFMNGTFLEPYSINDDGQIAGDAFIAGTGAFLFDGGTFTLLSPPDSTATSARGINDSGQVVGTYYDSAAGRHGFIYTPPVTNTYQYPNGISMVSVPYDYSKSGTDAAVLFGLSDLPLAPIATYDPVKRAYDFYPALLDSGEQTRPGRAYWVSEAAAQPSAPPGDPVSSPFSESLSPGWNMIADPFPIALGIGALQFTTGVSGGTAAGSSLFETDAVTAGLIGSSFWTYNTSSKQYQQTMTLQPYSGCWIYVDPAVSGGQPVILTFRQPGA